ncbi:MAG: hypothetical protein B7Z66_15000 [Chromatiales bacterium 21-64-14]|nr:MAG: hypothetical protein B7Z66_15000 [Chromatiales bacterium 21-64-14]
MLSFRAPRSAAADAATFESSSVTEDDMAGTGRLPYPPDGVKTPFESSVASACDPVEENHENDGAVVLPPQQALESVVHSRLTAKADGGIMCVATFSKSSTRFE